MSKVKDYIHKHEFKDGTKVYFRNLKPSDIKDVAKIHHECFYDQYWSNGKEILANPIVSKNRGTKLSDKLDRNYYDDYWKKLYFKTIGKNRKHFAIVVEAEKTSGEKEIIGFSKNQVHRKNDALVYKNNPELFCDNETIGDFQSQYYKPEWRSKGIGGVHNSVRAKIFKDEFNCKKGFSIAAPTNRSVNFMKKQGAIHAGFMEFSAKTIFNLDFPKANETMIPITSFVYPNIKSMARKVEPINIAEIRKYKEMREVMANMR